MSDVLALLGTFVRTVESGSFSAVARELGTSQPTVSRQIAALEAHLGCLLFQRSTRSLALTDDGRVFYGHAQRTLEAAAEAESAVGRRRGRPTGTLRLACAGVFGRLHVIPRLRGFRQRFPEIRVVLSMNDAFVDLIAEGVDMAIRIGDSVDGSLVARTIGVTRRVVVATPEYLRQRGTPAHPRDLAGHDCVVYDRLLTGASWRFVTPEGPILVPIDGPLHVNSTEAVRAGALAGLGIAYVPVWHFVEREIEEGRLVVLLREFEAPIQPIQAVYPSRRYLPPKVRAAIDYFAAEFALDPALRIAEI